jgi:uncharacterized protein with gpF-like domain
VSRECFRDADISAGIVPAEALAFWRGKGIRPSFSYQDVFADEHKYAFAAAKVMREDVLVTLQEELGRAIDKGLPFDQWKKEIEPRMRALGWWEPHTVTDPKTGEAKAVNPPARLALIFRTNMRSAQAVGQYERQQRQKKSRPYLLYQHGSSARPRPQHLAWHGVLLPVDDDFWSYAFPPNGHGCSCFTRSVSQREADTLASEGVLAPDASPILDSNGRPTGDVEQRRIPVITVAPEKVMIPWENTRTGRAEFVPQGIDPGFQYPPARARDLALAAE